MSSTLDITILHDRNLPDEAKCLIQLGYDEANRLINIISAWQEGTELFCVNQQAGIKPVKVGDELFYLVKRSLKLSILTDGLFDVTFASIDKIWYFDKPLVEKPSDDKIKASIKNINYEFIELDEQNKTIFIRNRGTKIELGAIGKGYIANKIKAKLISLGIDSGLVNAGGDLVSWGKSIHPDGIWKVGIADPNKNTDYIGWLPIQNEAIATSGNYERFALIDGKRYSHIINPKTGYPVKGIKSVTVLSPDPELCDVMATSIFLMGRKKGLDFANNFNDIRCFIVDDNGDYYYSDNLEKRYYQK
ncbi:FAD:protein FMN transferase [Arcicella aurantiaca]|nr:FAD:protein FMN transferase [Arcicella aurantiaca]